MDIENNYKIRHQDVLMSDFFITFVEMTPEKVLKDFLKYWKRGNRKQMYARTSMTWKSRFNKDAFQGTGLTSFEIIESAVRDTVADFKIKLNDQLHSVRLLKEDKSYHGSVDGEWGVFPGSIRLLKE